MRLTLLLLFLLLHRTHATEGYVATLKGKFATTRQATVTIDGAHVEVLLHNSTSVTFRVPNKYLNNPSVLASANVKIHVKPDVKNLPLVVLKGVVVKVDIDEFRERLIREQRHGKGGRVKDKERSGVDDHDHGSGSDLPGDDVEEDVEGFNEDDDDDDDQYDYEDDANDRDIEDFSTISNDPIGAGTEEDHSETKPEEDVKPESASEEESASQQADKWNELVAEAERVLLGNDRPGKALSTLASAIKSGSTRAEVAMASILLSGRRGVKRDHPSAVGLLRSAAGKGNPDAQAMLGFFHASGIVADVSKDIGAAVLMWTFAAEGGSMFAKMALGYRYFTGTDVGEDCEKAAKYYKQVADEVYNAARIDLDGRRRENRPGDDDGMADIRPPTPSAMFNSDRKRLSEDMARRVLGEGNEIIQYYRHSADRGDADAQVVMGQLYYYGANDMPQDIPRARRLFEAAAAKGRGDAHAHLGFMELQAGRNQSAARYLAIAAERGDKLGLHGMGYITLHGISVLRNASKAVEFFARAAEKEHAEAIYNLGIMYSRGIGVPKSNEESYRLFKEAARLGHMQSNYNLGIRVLKGIPPVDRDCSVAIQYLKPVAQQGVWNKILSKAFRAYERGAYADSLYRYLQAAHAGIELAQYNAAFMYEKNLLSNPDGFTTAPASHRKPPRTIIVEEALELYSMSASQKYDESMVRMGDLAFGEAKDYARAAAAYEKATKMHNAEAMFNLGWMHARGFGMNPDRHMAKRYFDQAKDTDNDALIPATIAVYLLQYSESLFEILDKASVLMENCRRIADGSWRDEVDVENKMGPFAFTDSIILTVLFGILVVVVNARQRRMVQANGEAEERQADAHNLDNRITHDEPAPQNPDEANRETEQRHGHPQAQQPHQE